MRGEIDVPDGYTALRGTPTGRMRSVGVVVSRFNGGVTNRMLQRALDTLDEAGVAQDAITVMPVPGAFELPLAAMALAKTRRYACIVALGAIVRGETPHFDYVASECASGLQLAGIETGIPVSFGVLTVDTVEQGEARIERRRRRAHGARDGRRLRAAPRERAHRQLVATMPGRDVQDLRNLWQEAGVREQPLALDGRHEAALRPEPAARSRAAQGHRQRAYVCTRCLKGGKVQKAV